MELTGIASKKEEIPKDLNAVITKIVAEIEIELIYLKKGTNQHAFRYRLNIITRLAQKDLSELLRPVINSILEEYPNYSYRVFTFSYTYDQIQQGNLYFLNNCCEKDLVYKTSSENLIWRYPKLEATKLCDKIKGDFKRDMSRMKSFKKGIQYFRTQKNTAQSAFMMHQTFEQGYRMLEQFICGTIKVCHSIKNHQTYVLKSLNKLEGTFHIESDVDSKLLDLLEDAYSSARYTHSYEITNAEIEQLLQKLNLFIAEIKFWFNQELSVFMEIIANDKVDFYSEQTVAKLINDNELEHYERRFKFHNSFEMLCTAKSMMLLCVTCLQDDVEPPIEVNDFDYSIKDVLEFAIQLLPLKETSP